MNNKYSKVFIFDDEQIYTPLLSYRGDLDEQFVSRLAIEAPSTTTSQGATDKNAKASKVEDDKAMRVSFAPLLLLCCSFFYSFFF